MSTYAKFSHLSLATKIRLREKFTSEIFYQRKYPDLRYNYNIITNFNIVIFYLLLEVPSLFLVDQHQVEVVAHTEFLVDVLHGWSEVIASQEQPDGNGFPTNGCTIHYLVFGYLLVFCIDIGSCVCGGGGGGEEREGVGVGEGERERERPYLDDNGVRCTVHK